MPFEILDKENRPRYVAQFEGNTFNGESPDGSRIRLLSTKSGARVWDGQREMEPLKIGDAMQLADGLIARGIGPQTASLHATNLEQEIDN